MQVISEKHNIIGEGPIWNEKEQILYFVNGFAQEICTINIQKCETKVFMNHKASALAFDEENNLIVSQKDGVYILNKNGTRRELYDTAVYNLKNCNDMKVGPDRRIYVGTQCEKRLGISDKTDGKLYSIDKEGNVRTLLDGLILSNGLEWSVDEKFFYHTDSDTKIIKEYSFDKKSGDIEFTGREVYVPGVDGFTIDKSGNLLVACWGKKHIAIIDTKKLEITDHLPTPAKIPASCGFGGTDMKTLVVVTASYNADIGNDAMAGYTFAYNHAVGGRLPYIFPKSNFKK